MKHSVVVSLSPHGSFDGSDPKSVTIEGGAKHGIWTPTLTFKDLSPGLKGAFEILAGEGGVASELVGSIMGTDGFGGMMKFRALLKKLEECALLEYELRVDDAPWMTIRPLSIFFRFAQSLKAPEAGYVMSRFAYTRKNEEGRMILTAPTAYAEAIVHDDRVLSALHALSSAKTAAELAEGSKGMDGELALALLNAAHNAGGVVPVDADGQAKEDTDPALAQWSFHDLNYHASCRLGRHRNPYGATFKHVGRFEMLPVVKPRMSGEVIELFKPDLEKLEKEEPSFTTVQEARRSVRTYGDKPIRVEQLGEFLYRTARIKKIVEAGSVSWRPSPAGGGIHELEVYPVVNQCEGLDRGLYHYDPKDHVLCRVESAPEPLLNRLIELAGLAGVLEQSPQIVFVYAARFQRIQIKYESVAYAVTMKNVGCLMQSMYLVAEAMGLAGCSIGGGDSDLFAKLAGLDYYAETSVGEWLLGSGPEVRPEPLTPPKGATPAPGSDS